MENEKAKTTNYNAQDFMMAFASSFEKNVQSAAKNENYDAEDDAMNSDPDLYAFAFDEHVNIIDDDEDMKILTEDTEEIMPEEPEDDVALTPKQIKKAEKEAKKQAKWDKKEAKRNAKIDRQQKNNTRVMLSGAIFLGVVCIFLLVMNHFQLSFGDIPDVLSGEKALSTTTTMPLIRNEQTAATPTPPAQGNYIVTAEDGVYLRESANSSASRIAVLENGTKIAVSAFRYDSENECFWGRAGTNGTYGWVLMSALVMDDSPIESVATTAGSLG